MKLFFPRDPNQPIVEESILQELAQKFNLSERDLKEFKNYYTKPSQYWTGVEINSRKTHFKCSPYENSAEEFLKEHQDGEVWVKEENKNAVVQH